MDHHGTTDIASGKKEGKKFLSYWARNGFKIAGTSPVAEAAGLPAVLGRPVVPARVRLLGALIVDVAALAYMLRVASMERRISSFGEKGSRKWGPPTSFRNFSNGWAGWLGWVEWFSNISIFLKESSDVQTPAIS